MKIVYQYGCIHDFLGIDEKREVDMTDEERKEYFFKILDQIKKLGPATDQGWFNYFLQWFCQNYGEYECDDKPCECCGDYTQSWTVDLE